MNFTIQTDPLLKALELTQKICPPKQSIPVLSCALIEYKAGDITVTRDSLESRISVGFTADCEEFPAFLASPKLLAAALRADEAQITVNETNIVVKSGGKSTISTLDAKTFPLPWKMVPRHPVDTIELLSAIRTTVPCCSTEDSANPSLWGVLYDQSTSRLIGCDGKVFAASPVAMLLDEKFILPSTLAKVIPYIFKPEDSISIGTFESVFSVASQNILYQCKLLDCMYPRYDPFLEISGPVVSLEREPLLNCLKSLSAFMGEFSPVEIEKVGDAWNITSSLDSNTSTVEIPASGPDHPKIRLSADRMIRILQNWSADSIRISVGEVGLLIKPTSSESPVAAMTLLRGV